ncbi:hypothetical protein VTI28DRAFT_6704 [Corynascus sepedonium]
MASGPFSISLCLFLLRTRDQDDTTSGFSSTAFSDLARITIGLTFTFCLDKHDEMEKKSRLLLGKHISLRRRWGSSGQKRCPAARPASALSIAFRGIFVFFSPPLLIFFVSPLPFPISSLPPLPRRYLETSNFQRYPPFGTERRFGDGCRGSWALLSAPRARRVVTWRYQRQAGKGQEAGQIGRGKDV